MRRLLLLIDPTRAERDALSGAEYFETGGTEFCVFVEPPLNTALLAPPRTVRLAIARVVPFEAATWTEAATAAAQWAVDHAVRLARERAARMLIN
jgi:hypothetical protein